MKRRAEDRKNYVGLTSREIEVLRERYGLDLRANATYQTIADDLKITRQRANVIDASGLSKIVWLLEKGYAKTYKQMEEQIVRHSNNGNGNNGNGNGNYTSTDLPSEESIGLFRYLLPTRVGRALLRAGFTSDESIRSTPDDLLLRVVDGFGPVALKAVRSVLPFQRVEERTGEADVAGEAEEVVEGEVKSTENIYQWRK